MKVRGIRDLRVAQKMIIMAILAVAPLALGIALYILPMFAGKLLESRQDYVQNLVQVAAASLEHLEARVQAGELSVEEAKREAVAHIKDLRYQGNNYFWINDLGPKMVMHPTNSALDGTDLSTYRDKKGLLLFVEFVKICQTKGEGYVSYFWPRPGSDVPVEKLSYVKLFKPWGWIIGTGIYIDDVAAENQAMRWRLGVLVAIALLLGGLGTRWVARHITVPLQLTVDAMKEVAAGNLTHKVQLTQRDELGTLASTVNDMTDSLRTLVAKTTEAGTSLGAAAEQLSAAITQVASSNQELSAQSHSMATASEQISATVAQVAQNTESVNDSSGEARRVAVEGGQVIAEAVSAMNDVADVVQHAAATVATLGEQSEAIGAVVDMIEDVADQTNLLALNAAIEAARAGEHGRGFAVVADEVRKLAEKTMRATQEISSTISRIQSESRSAVSAMERGRGAVGNGMELGNRAGDAIQKIEDRISDASGDTEQIAAAIEELATTVHELAANMEQIATGVQESSAATAEIAQTSETVSAKAKELIEATHQFRL